MVYYFYLDNGDQWTTTDFEECVRMAKAAGENKIRDTDGGEYWID